jgi:hypothetical protein
LWVFFCSCYSCGGTCKVVAVVEMFCFVVSCRFALREKNPLTEYQIQVRNEGPYRHYFRISTSPVIRVVIYWTAVLHAVGLSHGVKLVRKLCRLLSTIGCFVASRSACYLHWREEAALSAAMSLDQSVVFVSREKKQLCPLLCQSACCLHWREESALSLSLESCRLLC